MIIGSKEMRGQLGQSLVFCSFLMVYLLMFCHVSAEFSHGDIPLADGAILHQNLIHFGRGWRKMGVVLGFGFVFGLL